MKDSELLETVAVIPKNSAQEYRIGVYRHASGHEWVDLRLWYDIHLGDGKPGKGVTLPLRLVREVAEAFEKACALELVRKAGVAE